MNKLSVIAASFVALAASTAVRAEHVQATLSGYQEVPAVSTAAAGDRKSVV